MSRPFVLAIAGLLALVALCSATLDIRSDVDALFGEHEVRVSALDTPADRLTIVAIAAAAPEPRLAAAEAVTALLQSDPLVASVLTGPVAPSAAFLDWLWQRRFQLMPPGADDLAPEAMAARLDEARLMLAGAESLAISDKLLTDPTGSFARLVAALSSSAQRLSQEGGRWVSKDGGAILLFVTLADRPFEASEVAALAAAVRTAAEASGARADLLGPRVISAEVAGWTAAGSAWSAGIASVLLLVTLAVLLRSLAAVGLALVPVAIGIALAAVAVQAIFGSVHVVALGFGGALCGLGLDYPLHLVTRTADARRRAARLVLIGAVTTSIGFLALVGSGIEALVQTGVFVAAGLTTAALAARLLAPAEPARLRALPLDRLAPRWRHRRALELALVALGGLTVIAAPSARPQALFPLPDHLTAGIERIAGMMDLPSGQYAVAVEGADLTALLAAQRRLAPALDAARESGAIAGYDMLAAVFPAAAAADALPTPEAFEARARAALAEVGMKPGFAERQSEAYRAALAAPPLTLTALEAHPELRALAASIRRTPEGLREEVRLYGVTDAAALTALGPDARLIDRARPITAGLAEMRDALVLWFAIGALASMTVLAAALRDGARTASIALTCAASIGATAAVITLTLGPLGVFQIVALTLVTGIGIDYGLFLSRPTGAPAEPGARQAAVRSVALCAASTLIAFGVMAFSGVKLLQEIGMTVSLGVIAMLTLSMIMPPEADRAHR